MLLYRVEQKTACYNIIIVVTITIMMSEFICIYTKKVKFIQILMLIVVETRWKYCILIIKKLTTMCLYDCHMTRQVTR